MTKLNWNKYFIKDYVKSLKTSVGSLISSPNEIESVISEMKKYRGAIEGGICIRQFENFLPNTEKRYFIINNQPYSIETDEEIPPIVLQCTQRIASPFFSIDIAQRDDNYLRVVEIGDGQVSDLVGWSTKRFAEIWITAA